MCMVALLPPAKKLSLPWCSAGRLASLLDAKRLNLNMVCSKFKYQYTGRFWFLIFLGHFFQKVQMQMMLSRAQLTLTEFWKDQKELLQMLRNELLSIFALWYHIFCLRTWQKHLWQHINAQGVVLQTNLQSLDIPRFIFPGISLGNGFFDSRNFLKGSTVHNWESFSLTWLFT